jgi:hypothetical protein
MESDVACNLQLMRRLEVLLNLLILASNDDAVLEGAPAGTNIAGRSATGANIAGANVAAALRGGAEAYPSRPQTSACFDLPKDDPIVTPAMRGWSSIHFAAPPKVVEHWKAAVRLYRVGEGGEQGGSGSTESLPIWAAVSRFLYNALEVWLNTDPETVPTQADVHERDEYRCMVPGCGRRATLEGHHIEYGLKKKNNHLCNRLSLCHLHHKLLHKKIISITGRAPFPLCIRIGRVDSKVALHYIGQRRIRPPGPIGASTVDCIAVAGT